MTFGSRAAVRRISALLALGLAASCAGRLAREPAPSPDAVAAGPTCRVGPDGGPVMADRGIGGTGAPAPTRVADRGIGGTGIIGVITGFGSVCVNGEEVELHGELPVSVDENVADPSALRAGQLVALEAAGGSGALRARTVAVRHEVSGPVEAVSPGRLRIAGQDVAVPAVAWGASRAAAVGDWLAVSGLRQPDGTILATRLDPRPPGPVLVHGTLTSVEGRLHIGALPVDARPEAGRFLGQEVTASGIMLGDGLQAVDVRPDRLVADPGGYFGAGVTVLLVEGFVVASGRDVRVGRTLLPAGPGFAGMSGRGVVVFRRTEPGRFEATTAFNRTPGEAGRISTPAPTPRGIGGIGGTGGPGRGSGEPGSGRGANGGDGDRPGRAGPGGRDGGASDFGGGDGGGRGGGFGG